MAINIFIQEAEETWPLFFVQTLLKIRVIYKDFYEKKYHFYFGTFFSFNFIRKELTYGKAGKRFSSRSN